MDGSRSAPLIGQHEKQDSCDVHGMFTSRGFTLAKTTRWLGCPQCSQDARDAAGANQAKKQVEEAQKRIESRLERCGIPLRYRAKDFDSFVADEAGKERALSTAMSFAHGFDQHRAKGTVLVFSGMPGTGKSHLAIAIAQVVMARRTAMYISALDAVRMIRDTWRRSSSKTETEVLTMLASVDLLVLDEVGVQYGTEAEQITLFDIIDKRYRDLMPTILLTNQGKAGLKAFLGERSFDRLREGGMWVAFDWASQRGAVPA